MSPKMLADVYIRDPVSSLTHLATAAFSVYFTAILWRLSIGDAVKRASLVCFGTCAVCLYLASGLYHALPLKQDSPALDVFRRLDHSAIYLLIAGTFTPVFAVMFAGRARRLLLASAWGCAAAGIVVKWCAPVDADPLGVTLYLAMGWLAVIPILYLYRRMGWRVIFWSLAGGLAYTVGAICELTKWPVLIPGVVGWHEVFHMCVMAGTGMHLLFMLQVVLPHRRGPAPAGVRSVAD